MKGGGGRVRQGCYYFVHIFFSGASSTKQHHGLFLTFLNVLSRPKNKKNILNFNQVNDEDELILSYCKKDSLSF